MKRAGKSIGLAAAAVGVALFAAGPASAMGMWETVSTNSTWKCGPTKQHTAVPGVGFQACMVFGTLNESDEAKSVLVVTNNSSKAIALEGSITQTWNGQTIDCQPSVLNPGFTRGCYNHQMPIKCGRNTAYGDLRVNGVWNRTASKHHDWNPAPIWCP
ncbi:hypothetical protein EAO75_42795 [Streptomyces sp. uw30]|uniref:hypothetical protein n=1 Tax=Streptomyces sp. uw30 TaxID=1828179 RepID=UPI0011CE3647|nr:hypothetical protein [Streptomyces sp. uw30]TXS41471.1 hypothetical protein EAO75_42795 [Streptomyces sp. uw30]